MSTRNEDQAPGYMHNLLGAMSQQGGSDLFIAEPARESELRQSIKLKCPRGEPAMGAGTALAMHEEPNAAQLDDMRKEELRRQEIRRRELEDQQLASLREGKLAAQRQADAAR